MLLLLQPQAGLRDPKRSARLRLTAGVNQPSPAPAFITNGKSGRLEARQLDPSGGPTQDPEYKIVSRYGSTVPTRVTRLNVSRYPLPTVILNAVFITNGKIGKLEAKQLDPSRTTFAKTSGIRWNGLMLGFPVALGNVKPPVSSPGSFTLGYESIIPAPGGLNISYVGDGGAATDGTAGIDVGINAQGSGVTSGTGSPYSVAYGGQGNAVTAGAADIAITLSLAANTVQPVVPDHGILTVTPIPDGGGLSSGQAGVGLSVQGQGGTVTTGTGSPYSVSYGGDGGAVVTGSAGVDISISAQGGVVTTGTGSPYSVSYTGSGGAVTAGTAGVDVSIQGQGGAIATGTGSPFSISYTASGGATTTGSASIDVSIGAQGGALTSGSSGIDVSIQAQGGPVTTGTGSPYSVEYAGSGGASTSGTAGIDISIIGQDGVIATGTGSPLSISYVPTGGAATGGTAGLDVSISAQGGAVTNGSSSVDVSIQGQGGPIATGTGSPYAVEYAGSGGADTSGTSGIDVSVQGQGGVIATGTGSPLNVSYVASGGAITGGAAIVSYVINPPVTGGGGGSPAGSGGYRGYHSGGILKITELLARPKIKLLFTNEDLDERLPARKTVSPDRVRIYELRKRVAYLDEQLKTGQVMIEDIRLEVAYLRRELIQAAHELAGIREALEASPVTRGLTWWAGSAIVGLATFFLVPSGFSILKFVGYSSSVVLAAVGVNAALSAPDLPPPRDVGIIHGLGIISP